MWKQRLSQLEFGLNAITPWLHGLMYMGVGLSIAKHEITTEWSQHERNIVSWLTISCLSVSLIGFFLKETTSYILHKSIPYAVLAVVGSFGVLMILILFCAMDFAGHS